MRGYQLCWASQGLVCAYETGFTNAGCEPVEQAIQYNRIFLQEMRIGIVRCTARSAQEGKQNKRL